MCLYPKLIKNPKYKPNKKNGGIAPVCVDKRIMAVPVGCQKCIECRKQKSRNWQVRLQEEIRTDTKGKFITLTFNDESIKELSKEIETTGYKKVNDIATLATRRYLERWRKKHGKSVKHWFITELGEENGRIHIHGIIFTENKEDIDKIWGYGYTYIGEYVNEDTISYITKYMTKTNMKYKEYEPKILTSSGIGNGYIMRADAHINKYNEKEETNETYTTRKGFKIALPTYYRNKIYSEEEKEKLWIEKINKEERYILGQKISIKNGEEEYKKTLKEAQRKNTRMGYGKREEWNKQEYQKMREILELSKDSPAPRKRGNLKTS